MDAQRLERLIEVGRSLVAELHLPNVLDRVLEVARDLTGARYAALGILDEEKRELEQFLTVGIDEDERIRIGSLPRGHGVLGLLISDPKPLRLEDVGSHPDSYGFPPDHPPMKTFLGVPVLIRGEAWGNLYLTDKQGGPFTEEDEEALLVLADWAAIAIENARLYEGVQRRRGELERAVRGLEATIEIARALAGETELERVLELIVKRGRALVEATAVVIMLLEGDELVVEATAGDIAPSAAGARVPVSGSLSGSVLLTGRAERLKDVQSQLRRAPVVMAGATSALLVPLVFRGTAHGVLAAFDRRVGGPGVHGRGRAADVGLRRERGGRGRDGEVRRRGPAATLDRRLRAGAQAVGARAARRHPAGACGPRRDARVRLAGPVGGRRSRGCRRARSSRSARRSPSCGR